MISLRIQTLAAAVAGAASLLAGAAHAGGRPCATAAECGGSYRPASASYAFAPPGPAYADYGAGGAYAVQGQAYSSYPASYAVGPAYAAGRSPCAGGCAPPPPPAPDCAIACVPAYQVVQLPPETVQLASDVYTGGVGVTEFGGGGGGGFNGNFEVQGFGNVAAFASSHAQAQADAVSYARSLSYAKASADANANAYAKATASASSSVNVNVKLNNNFYAKTNYVNKGGYNKGCDTCGKPQPVTCNTCGGSGGVGYGGGMGGWGKGGMGSAPSPRGGSWGGGKHP